jgi:hypothetical protein
MIRYVGRRYIDEEQWNRVITSSGFETIYPYTWYMDACADHWGAFVMPGYECIMPVAYRKKIGMRYTYQPVYCQQLGIYSAKRIDVEIARMFLHDMQKKFRMGDYALNEGNIIGEEKGFEVTDNMNYVLPLDADHATLRGNYNENCRRNLKRAAQYNLHVSGEVSIEEVIFLNKNSATTAQSDAQYTYNKSLFLKLSSLDMIQILGVREGNHLVAAAIFAFSEQRAHFLLSVSSEAGKEHRAMFLVVDEFIRMYAGKLPKLDFEGSNIPSIARFFRGFGAKPQVYQRISFQNSVNKLVKTLRSV